MDKTKLQIIQDAAKVACSDGNWNYSHYLHGMANAFIYCLHYLEDKEGEPTYLDSPEEYLADIRAREELSNTLPIDQYPNGGQDGGNGK